MNLKTTLFLLLAGLAAVVSAQHENHDHPPTTEIVCPVMGEPIPAGAPTLEFGGLKVSFCCAGCDGTFIKEPKKYLDLATENHRTVALSLFDPVTGNRLEIEKATEVYDFAGIRYPFETKESYEEFKQLPGIYTELPSRESLTCPVMKNDVANYSAASGFSDYKGVRYYFCCAGCDQKFKNDPDAYVSGVASKVRLVGSQKQASSKLNMAPTCAGCAGEARLLNNGNFAGQWMASYRYVAIDDVKARHRFTLDYAVTPRLTVGIERSGSDASTALVPEFQDDPGGYLRLSDGDALILPRFSWFISPEGSNHPSLLLGVASDRLSTPTGQAFFLTASKHITNSPLTPFLSIKTNTTDGRTVFPFGVNYALENNMMVQVLNDGDYTHFLLTKMMDRAAVSLILARSQYFGFSVSYGF